MSSLVVILVATIAGGLIGYAVFWQRQTWDFYFHGAPLRGLVMSFSLAGDSVFRGVLAGLIVGAASAVFARMAPW